jgi:ABC-type Na+ efflux pump permease subunit
LLLSAFIISSLAAMLMAFCNVQSEAAKYANFFGCALLVAFVIVMPFSLKPAHAKKIFTVRGVFLAATWISTIGLTHAVLVLKTA